MTKNDGIDEESLKKIKEFTERIGRVDHDGHDAALGPLLTFPAASPPTSKSPARLTANLTITPSLLNYTGILHGGATALIFDNVTSICLVLCPGWEAMHVSRTLNVSYLKGVEEGERVKVDCEAWAGRRVALIRAVMVRERDGVVVATCEHHKVNLSVGSAKL